MNPTEYQFNRVRPVILKLADNPQYGVSITKVRHFDELNLLVNSAEIEFMQRTCRCKPSDLSYDALQKRKEINRLIVERYIKKLESGELTEND